MEKIETPVVAGVGGVAILAALLSMYGGGSKGAPAVNEDHTVAGRQVETSLVRGVLPNQDGPWRAVCQEYAPYPSPKSLALQPASPPNQGKSKSTPAAPPAYDLSTANRGYKIVRTPPSADAVSEVTVKDAKGEHKITVHKYAIGDLPSCIPRDQLGSIQVLIATLPDPDKTEMRLEFDRYVAALERAAAVREYDFSGYWFPWHPRDNSPDPKTEDEIEAQLLREEQPGVLLFHNKQGKRLFLFVVGETSTSGINRMQMSQALAYRQELLNCYQPIDPKSAPPGCDVTLSKPKDDDLLKSPLLIAGPHFSGALNSLWEVIQSNNFRSQNPATTIVVNSPDASSGDLVEGFRSKCKDDGDCVFNPISITAGQKDKVAVDYLASIGYETTKIAEMVEDESAFGDSEEKDQSPALSSRFGLKLTYPRELSAARTLSDKQSEKVAAAGSKVLSMSATQSTLRLSGGESMERDRPLIYAQDFEATEVSNALADNIRVLRQHDIQCVVIVASNPLDRIYLLEYLHDKLPNVRLVVEDGDELEIDHPQFIDLAGTITISSVPIVPEVVTVGGKKYYAAFGSVAAEEQFAATTMLLADDPATNVSPDSLRHGLAVSVVGEQGFAFVPFRKPFEVKDTGRKASLSEESDTVDLFGGLTSGIDLTIQVEQSNQIPKAFIVLSLLIYVGTVFHIMSLMKSEHPVFICKKRLGANEPEPSTRLWAYGCRTGDPVLDGGRLYNLFVLNNQFFLLNLLLLCVAPGLSCIPESLYVLPWLKLGAWTFLLATGLLAIGYGYEYLRKVLGFLSTPGVSSWKKILNSIYFLITLWYLLAGAIFFIKWHSVAKLEWRRTLTLDNGISPIAPIAAILCGWTLWGLIQVRRAKWVAYRKVNPISVQSGLISPLHKELQNEVDKIHAEIDQTGLSWRRLGALFTTVGFTAWWQWESLRSLEPEPKVKGFLHSLEQVIIPDNFHWWYAIWGGIMLLATLVTSSYQLYKIWIGLSRLLHRLENTSMKEAFEKLGLDDRVQIKIWDLGKAKMRYSEMFVTVKSLRIINGKQASIAAETALNDYESADFRNCQASIGQARNLHNALNIAIPEAIALLEGSSQVVKDSNLEGELRRYLALRFVTFIRYVLLQMRNLMWFVVYGYFLACLSVTLYPFQGGKSLGDLLGVTFFIVLAMLGVMIGGILRNPMLRVLEDKNSNAGGALQVILHLVTVGGVPLLALLAWQFPWIGQIAFSWLRPLWGAVH